MMTHNITSHIKAYHTYDMCRATDHVSSYITILSTKLLGKLVYVPLGHGLRLAYTHATGIPRKVVSTHNIIIYIIPYHNIIVYTFVLIIIGKYIDACEYRVCTRPP